MNEDELRAALRRDEGDAPDPATAAHNARTAATKRRVRLLSTASSVAVVAAVAVTVGVLAARRGDESPAAGPEHTLERPASPAVSTRAGGAASLVACPQQFPAPKDPLGGATTQIRLAAGTSEDAAGVTVCAYGSTGDTGTPASLRLTGDDAARFVASLNAAPTSRPRTMCPDYRVADVHRYVFQGLSGGALSTTLGNPTCSVVVSGTSGTRYAWAPPADLAERILALEPS